MLEQQQEFFEEISQNARNSFYIDGDWAKPSSAEIFELVAPATEEIQIKVPAGAIEDISRAVDAARRAFDNGPWPRKTFAERSVYLRRIAAEMRKREHLFKRLWPAQIGAPIWWAEAFLGRIPEYFDFYADLGEQMPQYEIRLTALGSAKVIQESVGVCALIVPWNSPYILLVQKLAPALLAGCTVVVKPSPETPFEALLMAECAEAAGVPPGVLNVVTAGREVGDWLVRSTSVDKVSFTGSTAVGKHIAKVCADRVARVSLELGGKSAAIFCDDADLSLWRDTVAPFMIPLSGQACFSQTRVLVSRRRRKDVVDALVQAMSSMPLGDPWDPNTIFGPLVSAAQRERVVGYMELGKKEGAKIALGGGPVSSINRGFFVEPTVFYGVTNDMRIAREEIFGPVISVIEYEDEDDAIRIANDSDFGLSGTIFSEDMARAENMATRIRTGNIGINTLQIDPVAPFGGFKQSGIGREAGKEGLQQYLEAKAIFFPAA